MIVLRNFKELLYGICVKVGHNWGSWMYTYTNYSYIKDYYREYSYTSFIQLFYNLNSFKELVFKEFKELVYFCHTSYCWISIDVFSVIGCWIFIDVISVINCDENGQKK